VKAAAIMAAESGREEATREARETYASAIASAYAEFEEVRARALNTLRDDTVAAEQTFNATLARIEREGQ
jgi:F0F1-type ATP synthase membrane subunit b/b'